MTVLCVIDLENIKGSCPYYIQSGYQAGVWWLTCDFNSLRGMYAQPKAVANAAAVADVVVAVVATAAESLGEAWLLAAEAAVDALELLP